MNKTVLIAMIGLLTTLLVGQAVAGSITITRSGASVDEFVDGDNHSLKDSIYDHGILLGDGFGKATPVYRILLPPPTSSGNQIISIEVTIEGNDAWLSRPYVYIGTPAQVSESIGDGEYVYFFTGSDARNLLDAVGDGLGYTLDIKLDVGGLTDKYDLKEIKVTYEYSGVSSDILERFAQAYSSYRTVKEYESGMVDSLWNAGEWSAKEYFYPAVQECLAFADNLSGLSGSPYDSLKSTINCIENFQSLAGILESSFDYTFFWISYSGPSKNTVSSSLIDARDSFQTYVQNLLNYAFDGDISSSDTTQLNSDIDTAKTKTTVLRQTMWDVGQESWGVYISHDNGDGKSTAQIMLYSLAPLLNITYDENSFNREPSYLTGLINELSHFPLPPVTFNDANLKAAVEETLGIINPTQSDMLGLTYFYANRIGITDLTGLEYAKNLARLGLDNNEITDISALSGLTNLCSLSIWNWNTPTTPAGNNQISDISALSGLTNLTFLQLGNNHQISDISVLSGLTNLTYLNLCGNQIHDISALSGLTNLDHLNLIDNPIVNISVLHGLTSLRSLRLGNIELSHLQLSDNDLIQLSGLINLTDLSLYFCNISDISFLANFSNLEELWLAGNNISDISPLSGLTNLTELGLINNHIIDISPLSGLTNLTRLYISNFYDFDNANNNISDISALSGLTNLDKLNLGGNQISDISALSELTNLTHLGLDDNPLDNAAITTYLPVIEGNNSGIDFTYGPIYSLNISCDDGGSIIKPGEGTYQYGEGYSVMVEASPDPGYEIAAWHGTDDDSSTSTTNTVTMTSDKNVTVVYSNEYVLSDAITILQILSGQNPEHDQLSCYDVNGNGRIGMEEVIYILQKVSGLRQ